ncbi:uncharacterized protein PV09_01221 [Verruconis gallopava]|uniref:Uncharacterized protein n=1 Tax=Verruconis gallopava TaxID=253628 RepID=A0A0D2ANJ6_9PEZI|nr:uncharacterized protein PV09_01221 [Verruconis gallopava]KIW08303.1 hypothetical protein PV09_01221 [Verruconis gallopava]
MDPKDVPIPTYEEATSSTPTVERQGLLGSSLSRRSGYFPPASDQSVRSSTDTLEGLDNDDESDTDNEAEGLRREVEQMDMDDLEDGRRARGKGWVGRLLGFKRRLGRSWSWRPSWDTGYVYSRLTTGLPSIPSLPERFTPSLPILARLLGLFLIIALGYALFVFELLPNARNSLGQMMFDQESVRQFAQAHVNGSRIEEYLRHVTSFDHMAGTEGSLYLAKWMQGLFVDAEMDTVRLDKYYVYLNYPKPGGRRVAIGDPPELAWEAELEEEPVYPGDNSKSNTLVFHGLSRGGDVSGPLVYCNYGSRADYKRMYDSGIDINGTIALVKYYGDQSDRALKVKAAEEWGVKGVLIYSDPADDGFLKGEPWPEGRWRPADGVQRGTVGLTSWIAGDVLTPGWASTKDSSRISKDENPGLVNIPSLPLSWKDAQKLLQALKGHGQQIPQELQGGVPDVEWWSGDKTSPIVNLKNDQDEVEKQPIYNLVGSIEGMESSHKKIIVGNHRDAWCFGSGDPGSGTAVMLEVISVFKHLRMQGWRPLRTIEFISWDAEEYNLIGSTEHVENYLTELREDAVAYLNVDVGVVGQNFWTAAAPLFKEALYRVLGRVSDPVRNDTLLNLWKKDNTQVQNLNAGSDYLAFQTMSGTSSIDFGFGSLQDQSYPYHSCYETFEWMMKFGDPNLVYHKLLAEVWVLLILELSGEMILRLDIAEYANAVVGYVESLQRFSEAKGAPWADEQGNGGFRLDGLWDAAKLLVEKAAQFSSWENWWDMEFYGRGGLETNALAMQRVLHNERASDFETNLLDIPDAETPSSSRHGVGGFFDALIHGGLGNVHTKHNSTEDPSATINAGTAAENGIVAREQFKHVVIGPRKWQGYEGDTFPHVRDAIEEQDWVKAQEKVDTAARVIRRAAEKLVQ